MIHTLLFTKAKYMSRILLINSAVSCMAVAMLLLAYYFKDTNFIDVIFFYIIMSPIGFYGIFVYYKNIIKTDKTALFDKTNNNFHIQPKVDIDVVLGRKLDNVKYKATNQVNDNKKGVKEKKLIKYQNSKLNTTHKVHSDADYVLNKNDRSKVAHVNNGKRSEHTGEKNKNGLKEDNDTGYADSEQKNKL